MSTVQRRTGRRSASLAAALAVAVAVGGFLIGTPAIGSAAGTSAIAPPRVAGAAIALTLSDITLTSATLHWTDASAAGYLVGRDGTDSRGTGPWSTTDGPTVRSRTFLDLRPGVLYHLFVEPSGGARQTVAVTTGTNSSTVSTGSTATTSSSASTRSTATTAPPSTTSATPAGPVTKILVWMLENHTQAQMRSDMPYLNSLALRYGSTTHYQALTHPSLPNYLAIAGGSLFGVPDDGEPAVHRISGPSVFGQALAHGRTAKVYAESMSAPCLLTGNVSKGYAVKHNPWTYFADERSFCQQFDGGTTGVFAGDAAHNALPNVGMLVPNKCNDGHDCPLSAADAYLKWYLPGVLASTDFTSGRLMVVVTADEDDTTADNTVLTTVLQQGLSHREVSSPLNHYSLSKMLSEVSGSAPLRQAAGAPDMAAAFGIRLASGGTGGTGATSTAPGGTTSAPPPSSSPASTSRGTTAGGPQPVGVGGLWSLRFDDEFTGSAIDRSRWSTMDGGHMNDVITRAANVSVSGGNLVLSLSDRSTGAEVSSSPGDGAGGNGYVMPVGAYAEARISFPGNGGSIANWPAWWESGPGWPAAGEHDIAEGLGSLTVNYHSPSGAHNHGTVPGTWANSFHVYGMYRGPNYADVYWDGVKVRHYATDDNGKPGSLLLNVGYGNDHVYGSGSQVRVDYVRAWQTT